MTDAINRPYLKDYVSSILAFEGGAGNLGRMISHAETAAELSCNYTPDNICVSALALLDEKYLFDFEKFAKSVSRDAQLWGALVEAFSSKAGNFGQSWTGDQKEKNISILSKLCEKFPDLADVMPVAENEKASNRGMASLGTGQSPSPC